MKKKILIAMCMMIFCSCTHKYTHVEPKIPFDSFVRIEAKRHKVNCPTCISEQGTGSGAIIGSKKVLTAGHICAGVRDMLDNASQSPENDKVTVIIHDDGGNTYGATDLNIHVSQDICIVKTERELMAGITKLASHTPKRGKTVWSMMAPNGVSGAGLVPVVSGHYAGGDSKSSVYTIPAHPGSSGGPILNIDGEILGLVSQINKGFHHIVISPSLQSLYDFVLSSE
tara:strand:+ start:3299 stop:3979 length:681 start_codon:yes stop_codon:yes gene_type:complete